MGTKVNLVVDQGTTFETTITLTDDQGDLVNLEGYSGAGQIRKHYTSSNSVSFDVTLGGANGTITLGLSSNATSSLVAGRYVYDIELVTNSNTVNRILEGIVTVTPQVTR
jgi:hypothetical protein